MKRFTCLGRTGPCELALRRLFAAHAFSFEPRDRVLEYLEKDAKFLEEQGVMDYSLLLVGHTSTAGRASGAHFATMWGRAGRAKSEAGSDCRGRRRHANELAQQFRLDHVLDELQGQALLAVREAGSLCGRCPDLLCVHTVRQLCDLPIRDFLGLLQTLGSSTSSRSGTGSRRRSSFARCCSSGTTPGKSLRPSPGCTENGLSHACPSGCRRRRCRRLPSQRRSRSRSRRQT